MKNLISELEFRKLSSIQQFYFTREHEYYDGLVDGSIPFSGLSGIYDDKILDTMEMKGNSDYYNHPLLIAELDAIKSASYRAGYEGEFIWGGGGRTSIEPTFHKYSNGLSAESISLLQSVNVPIKRENERLKNYSKK